MNLPREGAADGEINELHLGFKGTMSALLFDLCLKTRCVLQGCARGGKAGARPSYGYRAVRYLLENGDVQRGDREVIPAEAEVNQRIFA